MIHFNGTFLFVNSFKVSLCELTRLCNCNHGCQVGFHSD